MESLPSRFKPDELARPGQHCSVTLPVSHFKRFSGLLASEHGEVSATVRFGMHGPQPVAKGQLSTRVELQCQRCLEPVAVDITAQFAFGFIRQETDADALVDELDPVLVDDNGEIAVVDFLEDELILQVPVRVVHSDEQQCNPVVIDAVNTDQATDTNRHNPFSELGELLKN
ncbi:MAG: YceD family protein [Pseudomonadota bacterium]